MNHQKINNFTLAPFRFYYAKRIVMGGAIKYIIVGHSVLDYAGRILRFVQILLVNFDKINKFKIKSYVQFAASQRVAKMLVC